MSLSRRNRRWMDFESKAARFGSVRLILLDLEERCVPASALVTSPDDDGPGTLRDAINTINASADPDNTITFDNSVGGAFATPQTIDLNSPLPSIAVPLTITGVQSAGENTVTISGQQLVNIFDTTAAPGGTAITFQSLNLTDGFSATLKVGGALTADDETISIANCNLTANTAPCGGGIYVNGNVTLTVQDLEIERQLRHDHIAIQRRRRHLYVRRCREPEYRQLHALGKQHAGEWRRHQFL